jgi:hypothetical protein
MAEGFDTTRFQSAIDDGFTCPICLGVLQDPMQCQNNEHYFCSGCIKKHLEKTSLSCPVCQDKLTVETLRKAPRIVADYVSRLKISCNHAARGCDAVLELGALQTHVQDCDFMPVSCSNQGCDEVVSKRDVKHHERELCQFKTTSCDDCGEKMPHHKYGGHGCVLRRDVDKMKKDLAEVKTTQNEMMNEVREGMQRMTIAMEHLEESFQNVVNSKNSDIVVIAGWHPETNKPLSSVERFNLFNQTWTPLADLKIARGCHAAVLFENQILVCGGSSSTNSDDFTDSIEVLDMNGNPPTWQEFSVNLPIKVAGHKCVVYGNRLLIIGGQPKENEILNTIYELLLVPPYSSKLLCHMKKKRAFHGVELFDDKVLIAGGDGAETNVEIFDITRNECSQMPQLPSPLFGMATVRRGDSMFLIGGTDKEQNVSNEIIECDIRTGQSKVRLNMKTERVFCSAVYHENTLVVLDGAKDEVKSVDCFNFVSNYWRKLPSMTKERIFASALVVKKKNFEF